jgi:hypothetical protein
MFSTRALGELEARRQQLIAASEAQRRQFQTSLGDLTMALGWVDRVAGWLHWARPLFWAAVPAAGYLAVRRARTILRLIPMVLPWWRVARSLAARLGPRKTGTLS